MSTYRYRLSLVWKEGRPDIFKCKSVTEVMGWTYRVKDKSVIHCVDLVTGKDITNTVNK